MIKRGISGFILEAQARRLRQRLMHERDVRASEGSLTGPDIKESNLGGGINYGPLSIGYRAKINNKTGEFISGTANTKIVSTKKLQPGFSVDTDGNILVGIPEFKLSLGFGVAAGAYLSINKQPSLTKFEKTLKEALKNKPKSPKEKPDGL